MTDCTSLAAAPELVAAVVAAAVLFGALLPNAAVAAAVIEGGESRRACPLIAGTGGLRRQ